jgi:hypothetical protein
MATKAKADAAKAMIDFVAKLGDSFIPDIHNLGINAFDKIGFDTDVAGRRQKIFSILRDAQVACDGLLEYNIAVWNKSVDMESEFEDITKSGVVKMGNGGGFMVVIFAGEGYLKNNSHLGEDNWNYQGKGSSKNGRRRVDFVRPKNITLTRKVLTQKWKYYAEHFRKFNEDPDHNDTRNTIVYHLNKDGINTVEWLGSKSNYYLCQLAEKRVPDKY